MAWVGKWMLALSLAVVFGLPALTLTETLEEGGEKVRQALFPYRQGPLRIDGLSPGTTLTQSTWQAAEQVLPAEILKLIQAGEFEITVQETTDSPPPEAYVDATLRGAGQVQLGTDGELKNYVAGLPFPLLDPSDPQAGLKAAWNMRYRNLGESVKIQYVVQHRDRTGGVQRSMEFRHFFRYGLHRAEPAANLAEWERKGEFLKEYFYALAPLDLEGLQQVRIHYDQDARADEEWSYDPRTRRVRKTVYNPIASSSVGLTYLLEDRLGFVGRLHPYEWQLRGRQVVLAPFGIKAEAPRFGGKGGWYPGPLGAARRAGFGVPPPRRRPSLWETGLLPGCANLRDPLRARVRPPGQALSHVLHLLRQPDVFPPQRPRQGSPSSQPGNYRPPRASCHRPHS